MVDVRALFPGWRDPSVPVCEVVGRPAAEVEALYRADGYRVQVSDLDHDPVITLDLRPNRIRLLVRAGRVVRASQG